MIRDLFTPTPRPAPAFPNWKPAARAYGEPHPSFSATGPTGPWRCLAYPEQWAKIAPATGGLFA